MKATIQMFRRLRQTSRIKTNRNLEGFFAERMMRAFSRASRNPRLTAEA